MKVDLFQSYFLSFGQVRSRDQKTTRSLFHVGIITPHHGNEARLSRRVSWFVISDYTNYMRFFTHGVLSVRSLSPAMSWFLCLWIAVSCLVLCQATLYETIQQHHVPRPGRNAIQILGESRPQLLSTLNALRVEPSSVRRGRSLRIRLPPTGFILSCDVYFTSASLPSKSAAWFLEAAV